MSPDEEALEWFLADAKSQGLSIAEYERKYGIVLPDGRFANPAGARIRRHETPGGLMSEMDFARARHRQKRRR